MVIKFLGNFFLSEFLGKKRRQSLDIGKLKSNNLTLITLKLKLNMRTNTCNLVTFGRAINYINLLSEIIL